MIRLTRGNDYTDKLRSYKIFIDDIYRGNIKNNEVKEFDVDNGEHIIYAKIDWCESNRLCINSNSSITELEIGPSVSGEKIFIPFISILYVTFLKNNYLYIKNKSDCAAQKFS